MIILASKGLGGEVGGARRVVGLNRDQNQVGEIRHLLEVKTTI